MNPIREARLRPEFAGQYPGVEPDVWYPAATIAEILLTLDSALRGPGDPPERPLATEHFEFRGGGPERGPEPGGAAP